MFNNAIASAKADGTIKALSEKWFGFERDAEVSWAPYDGRIERPSLFHCKGATLMPFGNVVTGCHRRKAETAAQFSGSVKTAQGSAIPRNTCSPKGTKTVVVFSATAPEMSTF